MPQTLPPQILMKMKEGRKELYSDLQDYISIAVLIKVTRYACLNYRDDIRSWMDGWMDDTSDGLLILISFCFHSLSSMGFLCGEASSSTQFCLYNSHDMPA